MGLYRLGYVWYSLLRDRMGEYGLGSSSVVFVVRFRDLEWLCIGSSEGYPVIT